MWGGNHISTRVWKTVFTFKHPKLMWPRSVENWIEASLSLIDPVGTPSCFYIWLAYYIHEHNDFMKIALGLLWLN